MIRVRRVSPRVPVGKVYELEYRPEGDEDAGFHGVTRSAVDYLIPVLGNAAAHAAVRDADREWGQGSTHWAVELDETHRPTGEAWDPRDTGTMPRTGWWLLIPHLAWLILGIWSFVDSASTTEADDNGMAAGLAYVVFLAPIGLPWSIAAFIAVPAINVNDDGPTPNNDPEILLLVIVPALLNFALHALYRYRRSRKIHAIRNPGASSDHAGEPRTQD